MTFTILVTGGSGFIGSAFIRYLINATQHRVINVDKLTYAANPAALQQVATSPRYKFHQLDICDAAALQNIFHLYQPQAVVHLAAESHVDRSISGAGEFISTNVTGTFTLLETARSYWQRLTGIQQTAFRFYHVSTDEVFGDLATPKQPAFTEASPYAPSSPYAASKAASDHLVRAWHRTYGLPVLLSHCSNNYGPWQNSEKLIPKTIYNALAGLPVPVYGDGRQIRDWLYVEDHVSALYKVLSNGVVGESYNIGGQNEKQNIEVVHTICKLLDELAPETGCANKPDAGYASLIRYVNDRPGHDVRYAINAGKIAEELLWQPQFTFDRGLKETVKWYLSHYAGKSR